MKKDIFGKQEGQEQYSWVDNFQNDIVSRNTLFQYIFIGMKEKNGKDGKNF